jgi:hypothetical protein
MSEPGYPGSFPPQQQSSSTIIWVVVLILLLVIGLPILLVALVFVGCCGLIGVGTTFALQMPADMAKQQFGNDPVIQQHIGQLQSVSLNLTGTSEEQQKQTTAGTNVMVFDVRGSKGSGQLIAEQQPSQAGNSPGKFFSKARLRTSQGVFPLSQ